jgi:hypothetical protein
MQLVAVHGGAGGVTHVITPPPPPPPPVQVIPTGHAAAVVPAAVEQTCAEPMGHAAWHVRAPPPPVQQTPVVQLVAVHGGTTQVITPPAATQVAGAVHSLVATQIWVAPVAHEAAHSEVVPAAPAPPPPASGAGFGVRQQTSPPVQLAALEQAVTVRVPAGHWVALATQVLVAGVPAAPPPPPPIAGTLQHVSVGAMQKSPAPQGT